VWGAAETSTAQAVAVQALRPLAQRTPAQHTAHEAARFPTPFSPSAKTPVLVPPERRISITCLRSLQAAGTQALTEPVKHRGTGTVVQLNQQRWRPDMRGTVTSAAPAQHFTNP